MSAVRRLSRVGVLALLAVMGCASTQARPSTCSEPLVKARARELPVGPKYTADARLHRAEGKVIAALSVSETGAVQSVRIVQSLGYGLDESVIAAARTFVFEPATRCGAPVSSEIRMSFRFLPEDPPDGHP